MKRTELLIALIVGSLIFAYGAWYAFTFIAPALAWGIIAVYVLAIIYLPYNKITKNK